MSFLASLTLALRLVSVDSTAASHDACTGLWEPETDGWHTCVCSLETWRCEAQGWCSDRTADSPAHEPTLADIGLPSLTAGGCE